MALCSTDSHWSVSLKVLLASDIKPVKIPSYHNICEKVYKFLIIFLFRVVLFRFIFLIEVTIFI